MSVLRSLSSAGLAGVEQAASASDSVPSCRSWLVIAVPMPMSLLAIGTPVVNLGDERRVGFLFFVAADEKRSGATRCEGDGKHKNTRGFHNAALTLLRDTTADTRPSLVHLMWLRGAGANLPDLSR